MENQSQLKDKKEKVVKGKAKISPTSLAIIIIILTMIGGGFFISQGRPKVPPPKKVARVSVSKPLNYNKQRYDMTSIEVKETKDNIVVPLSLVKKYRMVSFSANNLGVEVEKRNFNRTTLPLLAYITPAGNLVTAVSYCEPCRSVFFHTATDLSLVCNVCGTRWNLESMVALSGACMPYPPQELKVKVVGGKVYIPKSEIKSWRPRKVVNYPS